MDLRPRSFSREILFALLSNRECTASAIANGSKPDYLFRHLNVLGAKIIIVEDPYTDVDYLDDFSSFYSKCFEEYPRRCRRLHFFSLEVSEAEIRSYILNPVEGEKELNPFYQGFVVVRPLPAAIIGRTVLKTYPEQKEEVKHETRHYTCTRRYEVNLYGLQLNIPASLAFQEQDGVISACATVALWSCFHKTTELFRTALPTPEAITKSANQIISSSRPIPSSGLSIEQICHAISHFGLEAEIYDVNYDTSLLSLIYAYVSMGIPVILGVHIPGLGEHAITIVGYSCFDSEPAPRKMEITPISGLKQVQLPMTGLRINELYAHDDQVGPFSHIYVKPGREEELGGVKRTFPVILETEKGLGGKKDKIEYFPVAVVIPVYHKIRYKFVEVQLLVSRLFTAFRLPLDIEVPKVEWDIRLTTLKTLKRRISDDASIAQAEKERLLIKSHPRFIWHVSLSLGRKQPVLDLFIDATDSGSACPLYDALWRHDELRHKLLGLVNDPDLQDGLVSVMGEPLVTKFKKHARC